jgi:hypothetical protein
MEAVGRRLREDPRIPDTDLLADADLQDHGVAFLSDIAQSQVAWEESEIEPAALLRDGGEIQRVISELHGAQRLRLGWGEEQIRCEFEILREEVERAVYRDAGPLPEEGGATAMEFFMRCLDEAERISLAVVQQAG